MNDMFRMSPRWACTVLVASCLWMGSALPSFAQGISVVIDNQQVSFHGEPPEQLKGVVLVPLRGVFEDLGATVNFDSSTKTIHARKGGTDIVLTLGNTTAYVNNHVQTLSQPATVVNGTTLVPLRFVAESLGEYVQWQPVTQTVQIITQDQHLALLPPAPAVQHNGQIVGQLTGVYINTMPQLITLRINGQNTSIPFTGATQVLFQKDHDDVVSAKVADLKVGDQIYVRCDSDGNATVIRSVYGEMSGTVKNIVQLADGSNVFTLNDGTSVQVIPNAPVYMGGREMAVTDIQKNERVFIRTETDNKQGYYIAVSTPGSPTGQYPDQSSQDTQSSSNSNAQSNLPPNGTL